jgi:hypothetical protein
MLRGHDPVADRLGRLQEPVGERRLAVVDVRDDAKITGKILFRHGTLSVANPPDKESGVFGLGLARLDETLNIVVVAHNTEIKGTVRQQFEDESVLQSRAAFEKVAFKFSKSDAGVKVGSSPCGAYTFDGFTNALAFFFGESPKLGQKTRSDLNP